VIGVEKIKTSKSYNKFVGRPILEQSSYLKDLGQYEENVQSQQIRMSSDRSSGM